MCQIEQFSLPSIYTLKCTFASVMYLEGCAFYKQLSINSSSQAAKLTRNCNITVLEGVSGRVIPRW